jgi:hypothetical protein
MAESETRPYRLCESCKQVDDHPRHRLATAPGDGRTPADVMSAAQAQDDAVLDKHFDCCAADGCNLCQETLDSLPEKSRHGLALAKANAPKDSD